MMNPGVPSQYLSPLFNLSDENPGLTLFRALSRLVILLSMVRTLILNMQDSHGSVVEWDGWCAWRELQVLSDCHCRWRQYLRHKPRTHCSHSCTTCTNLTLLPSFYNNNIYLILWMFKYIASNHLCTW